MQTLKMAIRNLARYKYRTWLIGSMILITTFIFIFGLSLSEGISEGLINRIIVLNTGDIIITSIDNKDSTDASFDDVKWEKQRIDNNEKIGSVLKTYKGVTDITNRVKVTGIVSANTRSGSCAIVGIEPEKEIDLLESDLSIKEGVFLDLDGANQKIYISSTIAKTYKLSVGDDLNLACQTDSKGSANMKFVVCGIFNTTSWKEYYVYINIEDAQTLAGLDENSVTHIRVLLDNRNNAKTIAKEINDKMGEEYQIYARDWKSASGILLATVMLMEGSVISLCVILFFLIIVILINNVSMSIYERTNEIGILKVMGMQDKEIIKLFLLEVCILSSVFALIGELLGSLLTLILSRTGIPAFVEVLRLSFGGDYTYPVLRSYYVLFTLFVPLFIAIIVALFPLRKVNKLEPAVAVSSTN